MTELTKNQSLVLEKLTTNENPQSAYDLLDSLRDQGLRAPLQIYRALDKLQLKGLVHRLESLNAYVACRHEGCTSHKTIAFAICERCGLVTEIADKALSKTLESLGLNIGFKLKTSTIELRGDCATCLNDADKGALN